MPEVTPPAGAGTQTPEGAATPTPQTPEAGTTTDNATTFSQADVDRILKERLARAVPADYEQLKEKAGKFDQLEESQKTELQKAQDKAAAAETKAAEREAKADARLIRAEIIAQAAAQGADTDLTVAFLAGNAGISVDKDGNVTGVKEAVEAALKSKPNLKVQQTPGRSGGEFGGGESQTAAEKIAELRKKGDKDSLAEARAIEIQLAMSAAGG